VIVLIALVGLPCRPGKKGLKFVLMIPVLIHKKNETIPPFLLLIKERNAVSAGVYGVFLVTTVIKNHDEKHLGKIVNAVSLKR